MKSGLDQWCEKVRTGLRKQAAWEGLRLGLLLACSYGLVLSLFQLPGSFRTLRSWEFAAMAGLLLVLLLLRLLREDLSNERVLKEIDRTLPGAKDRAITASRLKQNSGGAMDSLALSEIERFFNKSPAVLHRPTGNKVSFRLPLVILACFLFLQGFFLFQSVAREGARTAALNQLLATEKILMEADESQKLAKTEEALAVVREAVDRLQNGSGELPEGLVGDQLVGSELLLRQANQNEPALAEALRMASALASQPGPMGEAIRNRDYTAAEDMANALPPKESAEILAEALRLAGLENWAAEIAEAEDQPLAEAIRKMADSLEEQARLEQVVAALQNLNQQQGLVPPSGEKEDPISGDIAEVPSTLQLDISTRADADFALVEDVTFLTSPELQEGAASDAVSLASDGALVPESTPERNPELLDHSPGSPPSRLQGVLSVSRGETSRVAYEQVYSAVVPEVLRQSEREFLPPRTRELVRRYFESIRPEQHQ